MLLRHAYNRRAHMKPAMHPPLVLEDPLGYHLMAHVAERLKEHEGDYRDRIGYVDTLRAQAKSLGLDPSQLYEMRQTPEGLHAITMMIEDGMFGGES